MKNQNNSNFPLLSIQITDNQTSECDTNKAILGTHRNVLFILFLYESVPDDNNGHMIEVKSGVLEMTYIIISISLAPPSLEDAIGISKIRNVSSRWFKKQVDRQEHVKKNGFNFYLQ